MSDWSRTSAAALVVVASASCAMPEQIRTDDPRYPQRADPVQGDVTHWPGATMAGVGLAAAAVEAVSASSRLDAARREPPPLAAPKDEGTESTHVVDFDTVRTTVEAVLTAAYERVTYDDEQRCFRADTLWSQPRGRASVWIDPAGEGRWRLTAAMRPFRSAQTTQPLTTWRFHERVAGRLRLLAAAQ